MTLPAILRTVAREYRLPIRGQVGVKALMRGGRDKSRIKPRLAVYWLCRELLRWSYPEIGRALGKDHTTVMYGCRQYVKRTTALHRVRLMLQCAWWPGRYVTPAMHRDDAADIKVFGLQRCLLCDELGYQGGRYCFRHCYAKYDYFKPPAAEAG